MKRTKWGIIGSLAALLVAIPAFADSPGQQKQAQPADEQPLQGDVEMTEIGLGQAPAPVRAAIENWAKGAQIKKVHEVRQGTKIQYKAEIEREGKNLEVLVNEQGQVLRAGDDVGVDEGIF